MATHAPSQFIAASTSGYWGRGDSPLAAYKRLTQAAGRRPLKRDVVTYAMPAGAKPDSAHVTQFGGIAWQWEDSLREAALDGLLGDIEEVPTVTR